MFSVILAERERRLIKRSCGNRFLKWRIFSVLLDERLHHSEKRSRRVCLRNFQILILRIILNLLYLRVVIQVQLKFRSTADYAIQSSFEQAIVKLHRIRLTGLGFAMEPLMNFDLFFEHEDGGVESFHGLLEHGHVLTGAVDFGNELVMDGTPHAVLRVGLQRLLDQLLLVVRINYVLS